MRSRARHLCSLRGLSWWETKLRRGQNLTVLNAPNKIRRDAVVPRFPCNTCVCRTAGSGAVRKGPTRGFHLASRVDPGSSKRTVFSAASGKTRSSITRADWHKRKGGLGNSLGGNSSSFRRATKHAFRVYTYSDPERASCTAVEPSTRACVLRCPQDPSSCRRDEKIVDSRPQGKVRQAQNVVHGTPPPPSQPSRYRDANATKPRTPLITPNPLPHLQTVHPCQRGWVET